MVKMSRSHSMVLKSTADNNAWHWELMDWLQMMGEYGQMDTGERRRNNKYLNLNSLQYYQARNCPISIFSK